ncbi:MAG: thioredoxin family protein [Candidatus Sumerlaeota bacterium]
MSEQEKKQRGVMKALIVVALTLAVGAGLVACNNSSEDANAAEAANPQETSNAPAQADNGEAEDDAAKPAARVSYDGPAVNEKYPDLASEGLMYATLTELPEGTLLRSGDIVILQDDIEEQTAQVPAEMRDSFRKNAFALLEQIATQSLVIQEITGDADGEVTPAVQDKIQARFEKLAQDATVSDTEISEFYEQNREMVGDAALEEVKEQIRQFLLQNKQQEIVQEHIQTIGRRMPVAVSAEWAEKQAALARDNPVDKARASGKPTFVNFGAKGCVPCDMMEPIREEIEEKYQDQLNVVFVHVNQDQALASRYGVRSIPVLVFYDAEGKEVVRETGYRPREEIEKYLGKIGVQ